MYVDMIQDAASMTTTLTYWSSIGCYGNEVFCQIHFPGEVVIYILPTTKTRILSSPKRREGSLAPISLAIVREREGNLLCKYIS